MDGSFEKYNPDKDKEATDDDAYEDEGTIEEMTEGVRIDCEHVYSDTEIGITNGIILDEILNTAEASYEKDKKEWNELLKKLPAELSNIEDEDEIAQILQRYKNSAKNLS